jgi:lipoate-protein ligase A
MRWRYINTGENDGKFNMAFDLLLAKNCKPDEVYLRFYRWKPFCISLGANQNIKSIKIDKAASDGIDIVIRPTGGRAILHSEELTYSVVMPLQQTSSVKNIYYEINLALAEGLKNYDALLSNIKLEYEQPNFSSFYKEEKSAVCFAVSAKNELKFSGKKLVGSAQRKLNNVVLQHGSILCGSYHKKIVDYLTLSEKGFYNLKEDMDKFTIDLKSILNKKINYQNLISSLLTGFSNHFACEFNNFDLEEINIFENEVNNF